MTVAPARGGASTPVGPARASSPLARRAVRLAVAGALAIVTSVSLFAVAYAIGGTEATADNWVGFLVVIALFGGSLVGEHGLRLGPERASRRGAPVP